MTQGPKPARGLDEIPRRLDPVTEDDSPDLSVIKCENGNQTRRGGDMEETRAPGVSKSAPGAKLPGLRPPSPREQDLVREYHPGGQTRGDRFTPAEAVRRIFERLN